MLEVLERHGFRTFRPSGAYYVMTDIAGFGADDDVAFARELVSRARVAAVPGSSFYRDPLPGRTKLRFCFSKRDETMAEADRRLAEWARTRG
jgi:aminotransferase